MLRLTPRFRCAADSTKANASTSNQEVPRSVANDTPMPPRNAFAVKFAEFYMTKIPTGVREFGLIVPLILVTLGIIYNMDGWIADGLRSQLGRGGSVGKDIEQKDMLSYRLDPMYDDHGKLIAYRRVSVDKSV